MMKYQQNSYKIMKFSNYHQKTNKSQKINHKKQNLQENDVWSFDISNLIKEMRTLKKN